MGRKKSKGNGEGTIYQRKSTGRYEGQYVVNGKRKIVYQKKNEKVGDFKARFNTILSSITEGTYIEKNNDTLLEIIKNYVEQKYKDGITSDNSYRRDKETIKQIEKTCSKFINKPIQKIKTEDVEDAKEDIRQYSNQCIDKIWILLNKGFKISLARRKIQFNIMDDYTLKKPISYKAKKKISALTVDNQNKLVNVLTTTIHKYNDILLLQLYTGMRIGEVLALSMDCIDKKNNTLTVYRTLTRDKDNNTIMGKHTKTYDKRNQIDKGKRTFHMIPEVRKIVDEICNRPILNIHSLLFWNYEDNKFVNAGEVNSYLSRLNKKHSFSNTLTSHMLRHTFITRCREKGMDKLIIQELVGHVEESSITDDVYTDISQNFIKQELAKISF